MVERGSILQALAKKYREVNVEAHGENKGDWRSLRPYEITDAMMPLIAQTRRKALEEAADIADRYGAAWIKRRDIPDVTRKEARDYETMAIASSHIKSAIRALIEKEEK